MGFGISPHPRRFRSSVPAHLRDALLLIILAWAIGCSVPATKVRVPEPSVGGVSQTGIASWYGPGFHGKATASGEIYNQNDFTAAHQTLPLGSRVMVTNLENGRSAEVLINDRGPFAKGRIIDLRPGDAGRTIVQFECPSRGLIGFRSLLMTATRGTALLHQHHLGWMPWAASPTSASRRPV